MCTVNGYIDIFVILSSDAGMKDDKDISTQLLG